MKILFNKRPHSERKIGIIESASAGIRNAKNELLFPILTHGFGKIVQR